MIKDTKQNILFVLVLLVTTSITSFCKGQTNTESSIELQAGTKIVFPDVNEAKKFLTTNDEDVNSLTSLDRSIRMKTQKAVSQEEYLSFVASHAMQWTQSEKKRMEEVIKSAAGKLKRFNLKLPPTILLIKTTGAEEGNAAYIRRNAIVLPQKLISQQNIMQMMSNSQNSRIEHIFTHELFHIYLEHNPQLKEAFYKVVGFQKCNPVELPEKLEKYVPTSGFSYDYYIELLYKDGTINVMPIITVPNYDYEKKDVFFKYMKVQLLAIEKAGDKWQFKRDDTGEPVLFELDDLPGYRRETGDNTEYVINPEEIIAENFVLLVQKSQSVKSKWVIEEMDKLFQSMSR